ncbi:ankyrin [Gyrodon lividus]|nr:ankyrin [Gyrodon lividus]
MHGASGAQILIEIAQASQQVLTAATDYAKHVRNAENSRIRLQGQLQYIVAASKLALGAVNRSASFSNDPDIHRRLVEWLSSDYPKTCLAILKDMESLLKLSRRFVPMIHFVRKEDKILEASTLFNTRKSNFHFLLTMDIWNQGKEVEQPSAVAQPHILGIDWGVGIIRKDMQDNEQVQTLIGNSAQEIEQQEVTQGYLISTDENAKDVEVIEQDESEPRTGVTTVGNKMTVARKERKKGVDRKEVANFLRWLNGLACTVKHEDTYALRQAETCTWLPETEIYQSWRRGDIPFLWLEGKPGSGKSVLASSVIHDLKRSRYDEEVLVFFYCDFRNERSTSAPEVMRSLLTQLLRLANVDDVDCRDSVPELVEREAEGTEPPNDMKLLTCLVRSAAKLHQQPLIVIDALDECKDVEKLLNALKELNDGHIRLFVTSRLERIIRDTLSDFPSISLQKMTRAVSADMERHIRKELDSRQWLRTLAPGLKKEVRSVLLDTADGMFRWVQCQIDTLAQCTSAGEIRKTLRSLPIGLDETYERILLTIDGKEFQGKLVRRALFWLVAALRPLHLPDIIEALKIDLERRTLNEDIGPMSEIVFLDACGSLVTHNEETGVVSLSHFSVKEYLTGELICTKLPRYCIDWQDAHEQLARLCICYMSLRLGPSRRSANEKGPLPRVISSNVIFGGEAESSSDEEESSDTRRLSQTLLSYALSHGFEHLADLGPGNDLVFDDMMALQADIRRHHSKWKKIRDMFSIGHTLHWSDLKQDFMFYTLIRFAPVTLLERFLDHAIRMPKDGTNPLLYAASFNKTQHARILLSRGISMNNDGWVVDGSRRALPLEVAVECRHDELVDLLLAEGSRVPERLFDIALSPNKRVPLRIVKSLLRTDEFAEWVTTCQDERSLLHEILHWNFAEEAEDIIVDITRRLVQVGCSPSEWDYDCKTPLEVAAAEGHTSVLQYLLSITPMPPGILFAAAKASSHRAQMMQLLVDEGANIHALMSNRDTVLHVTLGHWDEHDCLQTAKVLVDAGCNPSACNSNGKMPFHIVVAQGYISIVEYLLSINAPLPPDILSTARRARSHQEQIMHMLIDKGAEDHVTKGLLSFMSEARDDLSETSGLATPDTLFAAVEAGSGRAQMTHVLINKGADVHAVTSNGDSVLHVTVDQLDEHQCLQTAKIVVDAGCNPSTYNFNGKTPLHVVVARGYISIVEYLLSINIPLPPDILFTAVTARSCRAQIMHMLMDKGADLHMLTFNGDSILSTAMDNWDEDECLQTAKMLIGAGCNPFACNSEGKTPLHIVVAKGHISVVKYLLSMDFPLPPDILFTKVMAPSRQAQKIKHMLIEKGADVHSLTSNKNNLLHDAINCHTSEGPFSFMLDSQALTNVKILVDSGCNPSACNSNGQTPLHLAVSRGQVPVVEYLLSRDVPLPSDILLAAVESPSYHQDKIIDMLINKGADPYILESTEMIH